jgi:hypothetical protein
MNEPAHIREYIRQVLALARRNEDGSRAPMPERVLFEGVRRLSREELKVDEFKAATLWNESRDYIARSYDDVADSDAWALTFAGLKKEGVR